MPGTGPLFGDYIKQLRESRGLSLSEAAKSIGISPQKLWDAENNRRYTKKIHDKTINAMARVYRIPVGVLIESTQIKLFTGITHSELMAQTLPEAEKLVKLAAAMVNEAVTYTPELESDAKKIFELASWLQNRLRLAYARLYPNTQKEETE
jgi:transcriptional regulator with XRE-family HTH domain